MCLYRQSCYLFGRDARVADVPCFHPSLSKQHAVLQYKRKIITNEDTGKKTKLVLYVYCVCLTQHGKEFLSTRS